MDRALVCLYTVPSKFRIPPKISFERIRIGCYWYFLEVLVKNQEHLKSGNL